MSIEQLSADGLNSIGETRFGGRGRLAGGIESDDDIARLGRGALIRIRCRIGSQVGDFCFLVSYDSINSKAGLIAAVIFPEKMDRPGLRRRFLRRWRRLSGSAQTGGLRHGDRSTPLDPPAAALDISRADRAPFGGRIAG